MAGACEAEGRGADAPRLLRGGAATSRKSEDGADLELSAGKEAGGAGPFAGGASLVRSLMRQLAMRPKNPYRPPNTAISFVLYGDLREGAAPTLTVIRCTLQVTVAAVAFVAGALAGASLRWPRGVPLDSRESLLSGAHKQLYERAERSLRDSLFLWSHRTRAIILGGFAVWGHNASATSYFFISHTRSPGRGCRRRTAALCEREPIDPEESSCLVGSHPWPSKAHQGGHCERML